MSFFRLTQRWTISLLKNLKLFYIKASTKLYFKNIEKLSNAISRENENSNGKKSIKHYIKKHDIIPLLVLVNFLTFGNISYFYNYLDESLQNKIARAFGGDIKKVTSISIDDIFAISGFHNKWLLT